MLVQILYVNAVVHIRHDLVTSKSCFDEYTSTLTVRKASHVNCLKMFLPIRKQM